MAGVLRRLVSPRHIRQLVLCMRGPHRDQAVHDFGRIHEQVRYIESTYPEIQVIEGRFSDVGWSRYHGTFGTVLTAESFQYLFLDNAVTAVARLLRPGGRWVLCDFFRQRRELKGSGHAWDDFAEAAIASGWRIASERDDARALRHRSSYNASGTRRGGAGSCKGLSW